MEPYFRKTYPITASAVDRFDRLKLSRILDYLQETAGDHCKILGADRNALMPRDLFWAVLRHKVQITRLPRAGEDITVETWPMPTTRTAYPRATVVYDAQGNELLRGVSLWVLMDMRKRTLVLPGKSGVTVDGVLRGSEPDTPGSIAPKVYANEELRSVRFTELDWNGHMNNCRYLDWVSDTLPGSFHEGHAVKEFTVCYLSEAREGDVLHLSWELDADGGYSLEAARMEDPVSTGHSRVFAVRMRF